MAARAEREELEADFLKIGFQQTTDYFRANSSILADFDDFGTFDQSGQKCSELLKSPC